MPVRAAFASEAAPDFHGVIHHASSGVARSMRAVNRVCTQQTVDLRDLGKSVDRICGKHRNGTESNYHGAAGAFLRILGAVAGGYDAAWDIISSCGKSRAQGGV